jgi:UPF0271 protein
MDTATRKHTGRYIDLNADLGEGVREEDLLLPTVTSVNIACGGHAGDKQTMAATVREALAHGVQIGAHPSFPDREGFGRRAMTMPRGQLIAAITEQIAVLRAIADNHGARLQHVKAHGALYNGAVRDPDLASAIGEAIRAIDPTLIVVGLAGTAMNEVLKSMGLRVAAEAFLDRAYTAAGTLVPREQDGAVLNDVSAVAARAVQIVRSGRVIAIDGTPVRVQADTLCLHGDTPHAIMFARAARKALEEAGITVAAMETFI